MNDRLARFRGMEFVVVFTGTKDGGELDFLIGGQYMAYVAAAEEGVGYTCRVMNPEQFPNDGVFLCGIGDKQTEDFLALLNHIEETGFFINNIDPEAIGTIFTENDVNEEPKHNLGGDYKLSCAFENR